MKSIDPHIVKKDDISDTNFQDVTEGRKPAGPAITSQPRPDRTGFKLSMFGLFGGWGDKAEDKAEDKAGKVEDESTREKLMEE